MKVGLEICFEESFPPSKVYQLFVQLVKFQPSRMMYEKKFYDWNNEKHLKLLSGYHFDKALSVSNDNGDIFFTSINGSKHLFRSISLIQDDAFLALDRLDLTSLTKEPEFICAYVFNEEFECIQSTANSSNYQSRNFSEGVYNSIKNTPFKLGVFDIKIYDTKFNPGRTLQLDFATLMVSWKMVFGSNFYKLVPKEKILNFPYADKIEELQDHSILVQLYNDIWLPYTPENIFKQWKWREALDYDKLESEYRII